MFGIGDLFQWERFVTPTVIKVFYWLAVVIAILLGLAGAMRSTSHGEVEAARAYGMSWFTMYRRIVIPSALRRALRQARLNPLCRNLVRAPTIASSDGAGPGPGCE